MSQVFLSIENIEAEVSAALHAEIIGKGHMKRLARRLGHQTVSSLTKQLNPSEERAPLQLRVFLAFRDIAPRPWWKVYEWFNEKFLGIRIAAERSPSGQKIELRDRMDQAKIAWNQMENAAIRAQKVGLPAVDRKLVLDRLQALRAELDAVESTLETRPVEYLPAREG